MVHVSVPYQNSFLIIGGSSEEIYYYNPGDYEWQLLEGKLAEETFNFSSFLVPDWYYDSCCMVTTDVAADKTINSSLY